LKFNTSVIPPKNKLEEHYSYPRISPQPQNHPNTAIDVSRDRNLHGAKLHRRKERRELEKLLRGGAHTAVLKVRAEVCLRCGERL